MKISKHFTFALVALVAGRGTVSAQAVGYDVTRTWTECTTGSANSCAALSLETYGLSTGGTHVAVGLSNLQGSSLFDNLGGSLLSNASFTMALSAGSESYSNLLTGVGSGGATGSPNFYVSGDGSGISLSSQGSSSQSTSYQQVYNSYYTCFGTGGCSYSSYYGSYPSTTTSQTNTGIAGSNGSASYSTSSSSSTGATAVQAGYGSYQQSYSYSCGFAGWSTCTGYQTYYYANNQNYDAGVRNYSYLNDNPTASTPAGASVWFSFDSQNAYDARNVLGASFGGYNTADGSGLNCNPGDGSCSVLSDVTTGGDITATPEPETWALLFTGLIGLVFLKRRQRESFI